MPQKYGYMANEATGAKAAKPCIVCDDPCPRYSWTDLNGEGYCSQCGTPYQLMNGKLAEGESYPRCNIRHEWVPVLQAFWKETHQPNGQGTFMSGREYQDQVTGRELFESWVSVHKDLIPKENADAGQHPDA